MPVLYNSVDSYLKKLPSNRHPVLRRMEILARRLTFPIVGPQVGSLLAILVRLTHPKTIIELGSGFGYSALWMALAAKSTKVIGSELNPYNLARAKRFFSQAGCQRRVDLKAVDALQLLDRQPDRSVSFIFNDVDKTQYPMALKLASKKLKIGGLLVTDNVLWSGKVARPSKDPDTRAIRAYNRGITNSPDWLTSIVPVRDGVSISLRIR